MPVTSLKFQTTSIEIEERTLTTKPYSFWNDSNHLRRILPNCIIHTPIMRPDVTPLPLPLNNFQQNIVCRDHIPGYRVCEWVARSEVELDEGLGLGCGAFEGSIEAGLTAEVADCEGYGCGEDVAGVFDGVEGS